MLTVLGKHLLTPLLIAFGILMVIILLLLVVVTVFQNASTAFKDITSLNLERRAREMSII